MFRECNSFILFYFVRLIFFFFVFLFYTHLHFSVDCRPSGWRGNATEMEISIVAKSNRECVFKNNGSNTWKLRTEIQYSIFHILSCESFDHSINGAGRGGGGGVFGGGRVNSAVMIYRHEYSNWNMNEKLLCRRCKNEEWKALFHVCVWLEIQWQLRSAIDSIVVCCLICNAYYTLFTT